MDSKPKARVSNVVFLAQYMAENPGCFGHEARKALRVRNGKTWKGTGYDWYFGANWLLTHYPTAQKMGMDYGYWVEIPSDGFKRYELTEKGRALLA